jgi:hypothetical protein
MGLLPLPRRTPEESGWFLIEDASARVPVVRSRTPDEQVRCRIEATLRVDDIPHETANRLLVAGLGAICWNDRRRP